MNAHLLVDAVVQRTMVFIAELATAGGVRAPLAHVAEQVFLDLTSELQSRGVKKNVIADMFGMALRTYHRRVRELGESRTDTGKSVWEAVLEFIRQKEPVSGGEVLSRFAGDDAEVVPLIGVERRGKHVRDRRQLPCRRGLRSGQVLLTQHRRRA